MATKCVQVNQILHISSLIWCLSDLQDYTVENTEITEEGKNYTHKIDDDFNQQHFTR